MVSVSLSDGDKAADSDREHTLSYSGPAVIDSGNPNRTISADEDPENALAFGPESQASESAEVEAAPISNGDRSRSDSSASEDSSRVDWEELQELQKTEQQGNELSDEVGSRLRIKVTPDRSRQKERLKEAEDHQSRNRQNRTQLTRAVDGIAACQT